MRRVILRKVAHLRSGGGISSQADETLERDNFTFVPSPSQATLEAAENHSGPKRTFCSEISNFCRLDGAAKRFVPYQLSRVNAQKTVLSLCRQVSGPTGQASQRRASRHE